jgi:cellulose synthase/poly-beta-1,6-N-acetylglucosamine synthase-like glycosyltransferase
VTPDAPFISVCIVSGRAALLDACLESLTAQETAPEFELLVCSTGDLEIAPAVLNRFPTATVGLVAHALPGAARNFLIDRARGELLLFLDDDVTLPRDSLRHLADLAATHPDAAVFGGPNVTPPGSSRFQVVQGAVLSSLVGTGPVRRRYGPHSAGHGDQRWFTLCNLAIRRAAMQPFDASLVCAEENGVLAQLSAHGLRMHYDPRLVAFHERRPSVRGFSTQMVKYGRGRGQLIARQPRTVRPAYLIPIGLLIYLCLLPGLLALNQAWAFPLGLYGALLAIGAARIGSTLRRLDVLPAAAGLILLLHVCYGVGVLRGLTGRAGRAGKRHVEWVPLGALGTLRSGQ